MNGYSSFAGDNKRKLGKTQSLSTGSVSSGSLTAGTTVQQHQGTWLRGDLDEYSWTFAELESPFEKGNLFYSSTCVTLTKMTTFRVKRAGQFCGRGQRQGGMKWGGG